MLVLVAVLMALVPAIAILYPFLRKPDAVAVMDDESSTGAELSRQWEAALAGLKNTELERALGNLTEEDYRWLTDQYKTDAALVMKAMELEEQQEDELLSGIEHEVRQVRERVLGSNRQDPGPETPDG